MKLLRNFLATLGQEGCETTLYPSLELPLVNEDLEKHPLPDSIQKFRAALAAHPIVVIASPEYNGSFSPALKNAIDWGSRPPANLWQGKICAIAAASPGSLGGARGLIQLRTVLSGIKSWVIPEQVQCPLADKAFDEHGALAQDGVKKQITASVTALDFLAGRLLDRD